MLPPQLTKPIARVGDTLANKLIPSLWYAIETMLHASILVVLCVTCFGMGYFANMEILNEPATVTQFCEQVIDRELKGKQRVTNLMKLLEKSTK